MVEKGVLEYFNLDLEHWAKRSDKLTIIEKKEEAWIKNNFKLNKYMKILDFACGAGRLCDLLHDKVKEIIAVDVVEKPLCILKRKNYKNVKPILASDEVLSMYPEYFNIIFFAQAIEFYKDSQSLLNKFHHSLSNKGELFISTWLKERVDVKNINGKYVLVKRPSDNKGLEVFFNPRTAKEIQMEMKKAGFKNIRAEMLKCKLGEFTKEYIKRKGYTNLNKEIDLLIVVKAEKIIPDILIEDDYESIGGINEMTYTRISKDIKKKIKSVPVKEFGDRSITR